MILGRPKNISSINFFQAPPDDYSNDQKPDTMEIDLSEPAPPGLD